MPASTTLSNRLIKHTRALARRCDELSDNIIARTAVTHIYNPLDYAWAAHREYLNRYARTRKQALFVGINPGPWGMAQSGIPFGNVPSVRDWLGIEADIKAPANTHPKRPVLGFACHRQEVSGKRLWQFFQQRYTTADNFFAHHFVINYCPLLFLQAHASGIKNITPDQLPATATANLYAHCDAFLNNACDALQPDYLIGIGQFAKQRLEKIAAERNENSSRGIKVAHILHPSPASPAANKHFHSTATRQLDELNIH